MRWDDLVEQMRDAIPVAALEEMRELTANKRAGQYSGANAATLRPHLVCKVVCATRV